MKMCSHSDCNSFYVSVVATGAAGGIMFSGFPPSVCLSFILGSTFVQRFCFVFYFQSSSYFFFFEVHIFIIAVYNTVLVSFILLVFILFRTSHQL